MNLLPLNRAYPITCVMPIFDFIWFLLSREYVCVFTWFCMLLTGQISFDLVLEYPSTETFFSRSFSRYFGTNTHFKFFFVETFINWLWSPLKMTTKAFQNHRAPELVWLLLPCRAVFLHSHNHWMCGVSRGACGSLSWQGTKEISPALPWSLALSPGHGLPPKYSLAKQDQDLGLELSTNLSISSYLLTVTLHKSDKGWKFS